MGVSVSYEQGTPVRDIMSYTSLFRAALPSLLPLLRVTVRGGSLHGGDMRLVTCGPRLGCKFQALHLLPQVGV
jgi:hypothetical protein